MNSLSVIANKSYYLCYRCFLYITLKITAPALLSPFESYDRLQIGQMPKWETCIYIHVEIYAPPEFDSLSFEFYFRIFAFDQRARWFLSTISSSYFLEMIEYVSSPLQTWRVERQENFSPSEFWSTESEVALNARNPSQNELFSFSFSVIKGAGTSIIPMEQICLNNQCEELYEMFLIDNVIKQSLFSVFICQLVLLVILSPYRTYIITRSASFLLHTLLYITSFAVHWSTYRRKIWSNRKN